MNEKEKNAIEYLKTRLYGNEDCKYIDVAQEDLRIFVNLINQMEKNINSLEKYSDEQEENIIEKNNNICNLEFQIEKLQKENERLKKQVEYDKTHICTPQIIELNYIAIRKIKDKIEKEIKYHEKNILDIETITMLKSKTAKEEVEIEFNKYAIVVLNKMLQELIEESEEK